MADNQRNLEIKITSTADMSGAKQTGTELNDLSNKTKAYIKNLEAEEEQEKKAIASKGEVRRGIREIGRELPVLGEVGRIAMDPLIGAFVLLTSVVSAAWEGIKELGNRGTPAFNTLTDAAEKQKDAIEELEQSYAAYERSLKRVSDATETVQDQAKEFQKELSTRHGADDSILGKSHDRDIAALEAAEQTGLITHQEFIARKLALDEAYFQKRTELENKYQFDQMKGKAQERFATDMEARALEKGLGTKRDTAKQATGASEFASGKVDQDKENLKKTEDKLAELEKEHDELMSKTTGWGKFATMTPQVILEQQKKQNEQEQLDQFNTADSLRKVLAKDKTGAASAKDRAAAANEDVDEDQGRLRKDQERMHDLDREMPADMRQYQSDKNRRQQESSIDSDTRVIKAAGDISSAQKNHDEIAGHAAAVAQTGQAIRQQREIIEVERKPPRPR